jgi:hypothetical protein
MLQRIQKLSRFESPTTNDWIIYFAVFALIQTPAMLNFYFNIGPNNPYLLFAQSMLKGDMMLWPTVAGGDLIYFENNFYLPYPPLPSIILLPFVAVFGAPNVNIVAIATVMACMSLYLIYQIFLRLGVAKDYFFWLLMGVFFGSGYWFAIFTSHHVYAFAHITSFLFQLLIIHELLGKRRWWLVGIFIGCTFMTRQLTIFYALFALGYMFHLHQSKKATIKFSDLLSLGLTLGVFVGLYLVYNYMRFHDPFDTGYSHIKYIGVLKQRVDEHGVFSVKYLLFNLYSVFIMGFNIEFKGNSYLNIKDMNLWGTSLLAASPFFVASVKAAWPTALKVAAWGTIIVILGGQLFYHNNGYHQVNTVRFTMDFLPLLIVLTALGIQQLPKWLLKGMVGYAILLNLISFLIHFLYQAPSALDRSLGL